MDSSPEPIDVLILGAGPAGMAAAMELSKAGKRLLLVEKAESVGGLAKTLEFREPEGTYRTDIGPHRFFSKNKYLYDFIADLIGESWRKVPRLTRFVIGGKFYLYPVRLSNVLGQIGPVKAVRMFFDYLVEHIRAKISPRDIRSFEDYAVTTFGRSLAEFNMLNYTEKIWGIPCSDISVDWATQRIGGLSLWATLKNAIFKKGGPKTLVDSFYYPSHGSGLIYETIRKRIEEKGNAVLTSAEPVRIAWEGRHVTDVTIRHGDGREEGVRADAYISSVPLTCMIALFDPPAPEHVRAAAAALQFRSQVYLFLTVNKESVSKDNWIYFPDKNIPFGRISEMKNFSAEMCPPGKTSLFIEYFCFEGDDIWTMDKDRLLDISIPWLEKFGLLKREDVLSSRLFRQQYVYPLYDLQYAEHTQVILQWLDLFDNFYAVGRPGRFRYTNQDHSLEMGILAAQSALDGRRRNVDEVGAEQEYFEKGYVPAESVS